MKRRDGDGDGQCYKIETIMHVIDVMAMVMDVMGIVIGFEAVIHVIDVLAMVMDICYRIRSFNGM